MLSGKKIKAPQDRMQLSIL